MDVAVTSQEFMPINLAKVSGIAFPSAAVRRIVTLTAFGLTYVGTNTLAELFHIPGTMSDAVIVVLTPSIVLLAAVAMPLEEKVESASPVAALRAAKSVTALALVRAALTRPMSIASDANATNAVITTKR